ncbi:radical SAM protein [Brachyspira intermedia]|uniref:radical SAM protein n=1 Tax=Brachyspira intermedia TaxID=84377 RepID=UPI003007EAF7
MKEFQPDDIVKSCIYMETGVWFNIRGIGCCCLGVYASPEIITAEEMSSGKVTYDLVVQRRKELFEAVNGLRDQYTRSCKNCISLVEKKYKDVNFEYLGGSRLPSSFNIQHYSHCNLRCNYCSYTKDNTFFKAKYNIIDYLELFREKGKLLGNNWIDFNGGEPSLLENFDDILSYLIDNNLGTIALYSNSVKYSEKIFQALKENKILLSTSIDAGTASTYKNIHGANVYTRVVDNLIKYKSSGTNHLDIKYIITDENMNDDDLYGFLFLIAAIRPNSITISINFFYGETEVDMKYAEFSAKLYCLILKYTGIIPILFSENSPGDPKYVKFSKDIRNEIDKFIKQYGDSQDYNIIRIHNTTIPEKNINIQNELYNCKDKLSKIEENINKLAWWIPIRKWRDNFRNKILNNK